MLQLRNISKQYKTGELVQMALDDVSLDLRDSEFISILGPSGSGKTTLLNIIGGLDRYDTGDLIIDGVSTKRYNSKAWDSYRNHSVGFVFQSYNLIPHQSVLANVELALTISGVKGGERRQRAVDALREVGLEEHIHKRPNQLSGGQMQRVAIARALVNDPKILLADEPTGALDTDTGLQVMEILKKVAEKRLVVMVTHNPEIAEKYSTRIVKLRDGRVTDDSNPFHAPENNVDTEKVITFGKSKMSFITSLALSFNNLRTKKARTVITSIAGSIGIIGIALILALSSGVSDYISKVQRETMESYPITIDGTTYDYSDYFDMLDEQEQTYTEQNNGTITPIIYDDSDDFFYTPKEKKNNLSKFLKFLNAPENELDKYIGTGSVISVYNTRFMVYTKDKDGTLKNIDGNTENAYFYYNQPDGFNALPQGRTETVSKKTKESYDLIYGTWPEQADECVIVTDSSGGISASDLVKLGYYTQEEFEKMSEDKSLAKKMALEYKDICSKEFTFLPFAYKYQKDEKGYFKFVSDSSENAESMINEHGIKIKVTGIIKPVSQNDPVSMVTNYSKLLVGYTYKLTDMIIQDSSRSEVVQAQLASKDRSVLYDIEFTDIDETEVTAENIRKVIKSISDEEKLEYRDMVIAENSSSIIGKYKKYTDEEVVKMFEKWIDKQSDSYVLMIGNYSLGIMTNLQDTLEQIGYCDKDEPFSLVIYPDTFEGKQGIMDLLEKYNMTASDNDRIEYYDYLQEITNQIASIINTVSGILIAFVAVSLVVSCIMIGIITHISVLERTKEIGILRALGASRKNISQVFNAETFIIGLFSGLMGIGITLLLLIPINEIVHAIADNTSVNAVLPLDGAVILVVLSVILTLIGGLIPSKKAAKKDPVTALRTE